MYWLDTSPGITTRIGATQRTGDGDREGARRTRPVSTRRTERGERVVQRCHRTSHAAAGARRSCTRPLPSALSAVTNRDVVPASPACSVIGPGVSSPPVPATSAIRSSPLDAKPTPHPSCCRHVDHRRRVVAGGDTGDRRSCRRRARHRSAPGWRCSSTAGRGPRRSPGRRRAATRMHAVAGQVGHRSRQRLHGGTEAASEQPTAEQLDHGLIDEHDGDATGALGDVDDFEAGDVDAEFGGQREHLGCRTRPGRESGCGPRRVRRDARRGSAGSRGPARAAVRRACSASRSSASMMSRISPSPSISWSSTPTIAGAVLRADVEPDAGAPTRDPGHVAEAAGGESQQRGVFLGAVAGEPHQRRRGEVRDVADHGDELIVTLRGQRNDFGTERSRRSTPPSRTRCRRCRGPG